MVLHPDGLLALDHPLDRLSHHLQGDEGTESWLGAGWRGESDSDSDSDPDPDPDSD